MIPNHAPPSPQFSLIFSIFLPICSVLFLAYYFSKMPLKKKMMKMLVKNIHFRFINNDYLLKNNREFFLYGFLGGFRWVSVPLLSLYFFRKFQQNGSQRSFSIYPHLPKRQSDSSCQTKNPKTQTKPTETPQKTKTKNKK